MPDPRILYFDIETTPLLAHAWSMWQEVRSYDFIVQDYRVLCWSAIWEGEDHGISRCLPQYDTYKKDPDDDSELMLSLWRLLDEADIVVAHNLAKFDLPKAMSRFAYHDLGPPSPFKQVDTLKLAKRHFRFTSNRLDDLGAHLNLGRKVSHEGFGLWKRVMAGDSDAWDEMVTYCNQDVVLLRKVYHRLLPYCSGVPNMAIYYDSDKPLCTKCGSANLTRNGKAFTQLGSYQRYKCHDCGAYSRGRQRLGELPQTSGV
jgi:hypothetical protein